MWITLFGGQGQEPGRMAIAKLKIRGIYFGSMAERVTSIVASVEPLLDNGQDDRGRLLYFPSPEVRETPLTHGKLIPIGGSARDEELKVVADQVSRGSGMVIITAPTSEPDSEFARYANRFDRLGVRGEILHLRGELSREDAQAMMEGVPVVFVTGGKQGIGKRVLELQGMDYGLLDFYVGGGIVSGTSAGASILSELMPDGNGISDGLGLLKGAIIDQHFDARGRMERLRKAVDNTSFLGLGIGEGTGFVYQSGRIDVFGKAGVHLLWGKTEEVLYAGQGRELPNASLAMQLPS